MKKPRQKNGAGGSVSLVRRGCQGTLICTRCFFLAGGRVTATFCRNRATLLKLLERDRA